MTVPTGDGGNQNSHGKGYRVYNKFGVNIDIDTATVPETIWSHGGVFPFLNAGITMDFVSSVAADGIAGTGAQKISVTSYNDLNEEVTKTYDTNGVTRVELDGSIKLVSRIEVVQAGTGTTNAGEINVVDRATGAVVYQSVEVGEGQTLSTPQMIPAGKKGLVKSIYAEYARAGAAFNDADMRFRIRKANGTFLTKLPTVISPNHADHDHIYEIGGLVGEAGDIFFWECIGVSANDTPIGAGFNLEVWDV